MHDTGHAVEPRALCCIGHDDACVRFASAVGDATYAVIALNAQPQAQLQVGVCISIVDYYAQPECREDSLCTTSTTSNPCRIRLVQE